MSETESLPVPPENEPVVLSRHPEEGGYTFLHRVYKTSRDSGRSVIIDSGGNKIHYNYTPDHKSFMEGVSTPDDVRDLEAYNAFEEVADTFDINIAKEQYEEEKTQGITSRPGIINRLFRRRK